MHVLQTGPYKSHKVALVFYERTCHPYKHILSNLGPLERCRTTPFCVDLFLHFCLTYLRPLISVTDNSVHDLQRHPYTGRKTAQHLKWSEMTSQKRFHRRPMVTLSSHHPPRRSVTTPALQRLSATIFGMATAPLLCHGRAIPI